MAIARSEIVDPTQPGLFHCVSPVVRSYPLCGGPDGKLDHRRVWLEKRLETLAGIFAIDVSTYAFMSTHMHLLLSTDPARPADWEDIDVARRWLELFPGSTKEGKERQERARQLAQDEAWLREARMRLASLSWFHRCLKEPLARLANEEDGCRGSFWGARFKSYRVADEPGALTCSAYIDLNPIRAGMAQTPETSRFTSVRRRIEERQAFQRQERLRRSTRRGQRRARQGKVHALAHPEASLWLTPFSREGARVTKRRSLFDIGVDAYLSLVDALGRQLRAGKRGAIPAALKPILERLDCDVDRWMAALERRLDQLWGTTIGRPESRAAEAARRGRKWVVNPLEPSG